MKNAIFILTLILMFNTSLAQDSTQNCGDDFIVFNPQSDTILWAKPSFETKKVSIGSLPKTYMNKMSILKGFLIINKFGKIDSLSFVNNDLNSKSLNLSLQKFIKKYFNKWIPSKNKNNELLMNTNCYFFIFLNKNSLKLKIYNQLHYNIYSFSPN